MTQTAPLIITPDAVAALHKLRDLAALKPVHVPTLLEDMKVPEKKRRHLEQMNKQSVSIPGPWIFMVVLSIETGQPAGVCRHMSMSIIRKDRVPSKEAVWMVAKELGFSGGLEACFVYPEDLSDGGKAINVIQPLSVQPEGRSQ
jgi:hypothetical protein